MPKIIEDITKKILFAHIPKNKNAKIGSVAPGRGIKSMFEYISSIVLELLKYLIQYISYSIIKRKAIINRQLKEKFTPQNKQNMTTNTWPIRSNAKSSPFSFLENFS